MPILATRKLSRRERKAAAEAKRQEHARKQQVTTSARGTIQAQHKDFRLRSLATGEPVSNRLYRPLFNGPGPLTPSLYEDREE
jgi:hypothetical protein